MVKKVGLILGVTVLLLVLFGVWFCFGWYMNPQQIRSRCWNQKWVQEEDDPIYKGYHFNNCLLNHGLAPLDFDEFRYLLYY